MSPDPAPPTSDTDQPGTDRNDEHSDCPDERFPTLPDAQAELVARRARAALSGSPHTIERRAYPCTDCGGAHLERTTRVAA